MEKTAPCVMCRVGQAGVLAEGPLDYEYDIQCQDEFSVYLCPECGGSFIHPRPTLPQLISFYPPNYHAYNEDHGVVAGTLVGMRAKGRARLYSSLAEGRPIWLFDVGAGDCRHFKDLEARGEYKFAGVEINRGMVQTAARLGYQVEEGTLEGMDITSLEGKFDIVTMYQLIEHVLDPVALLEKARRLLKPGGWLLGQTPSFDSWERRIFGRYWAGYHYPRHLQVFSKRGLREALERGGYANARAESALHLQAGISLQNYLIGGLGYAPQKTYGKSPIYSLLLLAVAPFCSVEHMAGHGGMMDFAARKPM